MTAPAQCPLLRTPAPPGFGVYGPTHLSKRRHSIADRRWVRRMPYPGKCLANVPFLVSRSAPRPMRRSSKRVYLNNPDHPFHLRHQARFSAAWTLLGLGRSRGIAVPRTSSKRVYLETGARTPDGLPSVRSCIHDAAAPYFEDCLGSRTAVCGDRRSPSSQEAVMATTQ